MAKGKYKEWITVDGLLRIGGWARDGLTDKQIANNIGINVGTLYVWMNNYPDISNAIKKGKAPVDIEVENALLKRALGYDYEEKVTEVRDLPDGNREKYVKTTKKHMPPDVGAIIFWLKNRRADKWKDRPTEATTNDEVKVIIDV